MKTTHKHVATHVCIHVVTAKLKPAMIWKQPDQFKLHKQNPKLHNQTANDTKTQGYPIHSAQMNAYTCIYTSIYTVKK